jgi:hypothetical protein
MNAKHEPLRQKGRPDLHAQVRGRVLHMPVVEVEKAATVEGEHG